MNQEKILKIHRISRLVSTVLVPLFGASYGISALCIYLGGGDSPYTRETVGTYLLYLLPITILTVIAVALAGVSYALLNKGKDTLKAIISPRNSLYRLYRRYRVSAINRKSRGEGDKCLIATPEVYDTIASYHKKRLWVNAAYSLTALASIVLSLIFILNMNAYTVDDLNGSVIRAFLLSLPALTVISGGAFIMFGYFAKSYSAESDQLKALIASTTPTEVPLSPSYEREKTLAKHVAKIAVIILAAVFITLGIINGDLNSVISKAVAICTECIGLG